MFWMKQRRRARLSSPSRKPGTHLPQKCDRAEKSVEIVFWGSAHICCWGSAAWSPQSGQDLFGHPRKSSVCREERGEKRPLRGEEKTAKRREKTKRGKNAKEIKTANKREKRRGEKNHKGQEKTQREKNCKYFHSNHFNVITWKCNDSRM